MAFNSNSGRQSFTASGGQTDFDYNFKLYDGAIDVKVYLTPVGQVSDDVADLLIYGSDYTVSIDGDNGGTVALLSGATASDIIVLVRDLPRTRPISYVTNGELKADTLNEDQDYQTYLLIDGFDVQNRALVLPDTDITMSTLLPQTLTSGYLRVKEDTTGFEYVAPAVALSDKDTFVVPTILDLSSISPTLGTVIVAEKGRGGTFNYDSLQAAVNNGGTIFDGWVREFVGDINVEWFDVDITGVINSVTNFRKAILAGDVTVEDNQTILLSGDQSIDNKLHINLGGVLKTDGITAAKLVVINGQLTSDNYSRAFQDVEIDDKVNSDLAQVEGQDFCARYSDTANDNNVYLAVSATNTFTIGHIHMEDGEVGTEYTFAADADGFIVLDEVSFGPVDHDKDTRPTFDAIPDPTGNVNNGEQSYTAAIGNKITAKFYGKELYFRHYTDLEGGIWDVYVDGTFMQTISTHQTTLRSTSNFFTHHIWSGDTHSYVGENITLNDELHEVMLIFKGDDPVNAPAVGPSRGYFAFTSTTPLLTPAFYVGSVPKLVQGSKVEVVSGSSIDDFAFQIAPLSSSTPVWVPRHSTDVVTIDSTYSISVDNEIIAAATTTIPFVTKNLYIEGKTIRFTTRTKGVHPDSATVRVIIEREFTLTANGLSIDKVFEFVADTLVPIGYSNQMGITGANCTNIVCNSGLEFAPIIADAPTTRLGYGCSSVLFKGEVESGKFYELAYSVGSLRDSIGLNKITNNSGLYNGVHFSHRADGVNKVYFSFAENNWFYVGDKIRTSSRLKPHILVSPSTNV